MKRLLLLLTAALAAVAGRAQVPTNVIPLRAVTLMLDTNGRVVSPTNLSFGTNIVFVTDTNNPGSPVSYGYMQSNTVDIGYALLAPGYGHTNDAGGLTNIQGGAIVGSISTATLPAAQIVGIVNATNGGEQPIFVRVCGPAISAGYFLGTAFTGEGIFTEYSSDGINWYSLFQDGSLQYTNTVGLHDPGFWIGRDGYFYIPHTYQNQFPASGALDFGLIRTPDFVNFSPVGSGQILVNTNVTGTSWAPDMITVNGHDIIYGTITSNGATGFNGAIYGFVAQDSTYQNWTAAPGILIATNESAVPTSGGPYGAGNGINDSFAYNVNSPVYLTNNAGQSVFLPAGTYLHIAYNWNTVQYDAYTNAQANMPAQCHLALTNITSLPNGSEGGMFVKLPNGNFRFYGSDGFGNPGKGRFFYSDNTNGMIGGFSQQNYCFEYPRSTFGQSTVTLLTGSNKVILQNAIAATSIGANKYPYTGAKLVCSVMQMPWYSGPCMMVQRSSDNATTNIGFNAAGYLDTNFLMGFIGANSGTVRVWYDQSGNGNHLIQTTSAKQYQVVNAGTLNVDTKGWPTLVATVSTCTMNTIQPVYMASGYACFGYFARNWNTAAYVCALESADYATSKGFGWTISAGTSTSGWTAGSIVCNAGGIGQSMGEAFGYPGSGFLASSNNGVFYIIDCNLGETNTGVWVNGTLCGGVNTVYSNSPSYEVYTNLYIGKSPIGDVADGKISEITFFPFSLLSKQQSQLRLGMITRFGAAATASP